MLRLLTFISLILIPVISQGQSPDSLRSLINNESDPRQKAFLLEILSDNQYNQGNIVEAVRSLNEGNRILRQINREAYIDNLLKIAGYYQQLNDNSRSMVYLRLYSLEIQSLSERNFLSRISEMERLQNLEISALEEQRNLAMEESQGYANELTAIQQRFNTFQIITTVVLIIILAGSSILIIYFRKRPTGIQESKSDPGEAQKFLSLKKEIEDLKAYLHSGKYIANQLDAFDKLSDHHLKKTFPELVLYEKDRVGSGSNFLWHTIAEDQIIIIVGQTNLSGLNGSLISILMKKILHHIITEERITSPSMVLSLADQKLRQSTGNESELAYVGCGLAYMAINKLTREVEFASSGLPLYQLSNGEVTLTKGNQVPLANSFAQEKFFETYNVPLKKGDYVCLSTSGYINQIGHSEEKRFGRSSFVKLLKSLAGKRPSDQYFILEKVHMEWKGLKPQTDDILVLLMNVDDFRV